MATTPRQRVGWGTANVLVIVVALIPLLWIVSLSFKDPATITSATFWPKRWTLENYRGIFRTSEFTRALINSIGIALISTFIAVVFASMAAYAVARLNFPGKGLLIGMSLLIAMFPAISLVTPLFNIERALGLLPRDPVGAGEGGQDGRRHAAPGLHPRDRPSCRARHVHDGDPRVHPL